MTQIRVPGAEQSRVGEVIATTITAFQGHCVRLHEPPALGALVRVKAHTDLIIYGVIVGSFTDGLDSGARPIPRATADAEDADVFRNHPDLSLVLRTCFDCLVVGFSERGAIRQYLPAMPPPIHYSIAVCEPPETARFTQVLDYFRIILGVHNLPVEEVIAAHIRQASEARRRVNDLDDTPYAFCVRSGREIAGLLQDDHQRVMTILQRIRPPASALPTTSWLPVAGEAR